MKANELMSGDWVLLSGTPYQVIGIDAWNILLGGIIGPVDVMDIEPIPITRELLEDNGWEREDVPCGADGGIEIWVSPDHRVELRSNKNHDMCNSDAAWYIHIDDEYFRSIGSGEVTYLHELQNEFNCKHYQFKWKV